MNTTGKILIGFLLGTTIGTITTLLLAPSSGVKMRKKLRKRSRMYSKHAIAAVRQYLGMENGKTEKESDEAFKGSKKNLKASFPS